VSVDSFVGWLSGLGDGSMGPSSNQNWMFGPRLYNEYIKGSLDTFIIFVKKDMLNNVRGYLLLFMQALQE
jgi:hypothetical protein